MLGTQAGLSVSSGVKLQTVDYVARSQPLSALYEDLVLEKLRYVASDDPSYTPC